jgi:hypothetical protein
MIHEKICAYYGHIACDPDLGDLRYDEALTAGHVLKSV